MRRGFLAPSTGAGKQPQLSAPRTTSAHETRLDKPRLQDELADPADRPTVLEVDGSVLELVMRGSDLAKHCCASTLCTLRLTSKSLLQSVRRHCTRATWQPGAYPDSLSKYPRLQEVCMAPLRWQHRPEDCLMTDLLRTCILRLPGLQKLRLYGEYLRAEHTAALGAINWQLPALRALSLRSCMIGDAGAAAIAAACLPALEELELNHNSIGPQGVIALAAGAWPSLHTFVLDSNTVGPEGAAALAAGAWPLLRTLSLDGNPYLGLGFLDENSRMGSEGIGPEGAAALAQGNWQLKLLSLAANYVGDSGIAVLVQRFSRTLEAFDFDRCDVSDAGARSIAAAEWPCLQQLGLFCNRVGDDGAAALATGTFPALKIVEVQKNPIEERAAIALAQANGWPVAHTLRVPMTRQLLTHACNEAMIAAGWRCGVLEGQHLFCRPENLPLKHGVQVWRLGEHFVVPQRNRNPFFDIFGMGSNSDDDDY